MNQEVYNKKICTLIKEIRVQKGIKQEVIASAIGINQGTYSRLESGAINITPAELKMICVHLGVSNLHLIALVESNMVFSPKFTGPNYNKIVAGLINYFEETNQEKCTEEELILKAVNHLQNKKGI